MDGKRKLPPQDLSHLVGKRVRIIVEDPNESENNKIIMDETVGVLNKEMLGPNFEFAINELLEKSRHTYDLWGNPALPQTFREVGNFVIRTTKRILTSPPVLSTDPNSIDFSQSTQVLREFIRDSLLPSEEILEVYHFHTHPSQSPIHSQDVMTSQMLRDREIPKAIWRAGVVSHQDGGKIIYLTDVPTSIP